MSFVPENISESPRMAPEKYGMYAILIFILGDKINPLNTFHRYVYFIKSAFSTLHQLSHDAYLFHIESIVNFSFTMLHRKQSENN